MRKFVMISILLASALALARDNGDGTYTNPIIDNDAPDSEVLRVGDDYYYLQSTFHYFPGNTVYHSRDLVNWQPIAHTIPNYDLMGEEAYALADYGRHNAYGRGSWAPTLKYHKGTYYAGCYVWSEGKPWGADPTKPLNGKFLVSRAKDIRGPWTMNAIESNFYDPGLFFDDDGRVYVFHGQGALYVTELDAELTKVVTPARKVAEVKGMCEGSHAYKRNGYYYIYVTFGGQHVFRSKNIYGPYEHKELLMTDLAYQGSWLHQGALVQTAQGDWWTVIFQDRGKYGREPFLFPVTWEDNWPVIHPCRTGKKPNIAVAPPPAPRAVWASDAFDGPALKPVWQWNHQPDAKGWSLTVRPGWLRLRPTVTADYWRFARNTLTQPMQDPDSGAVLKLDVSSLREGDYAGLGLLGSEPTYLAVTVRDGKRYVQQISERGRFPAFERTVKGEYPLGKETQVYLKAEIPEFVFSVRYSFSVDGEHFLSLAEPIGIPYNFFADWLGPRYGIFCYATKALGGYADVDSFTFIPSRRRDNRLVAAEGLDVMNADAWDDMARADHFKGVHEDAPHLGFAEMAWGCGGELSGRILGWKNAFRGKWLRWNRVTIGPNLREAALFARGEGQVCVHQGSLDGPVLATFEVRNREDYEQVRTCWPEPLAEATDTPIVLELRAMEGADLRVRTVVFE